MDKSTCDKVKEAELLVDDVWAKLNDAEESKDEGTPEQRELEKLRDRASDIIEDLQTLHDDMGCPR